MKKNLLYTFLLALTAACSTAKDFHVGEISAQNIITNMPKFEAHQFDVSYDSQQLEAFNDIKEPVEIKIFFAQWCHDSQREVPRLIHLFKQLNKSNFKISYYGLDTQKSDPKQQAKAHNIQRTPTVIVYKSNIEIGRFLEFPNTNWADDIAELLNKS